MSRRLVTTQRGDGATPVLLLHGLLGSGRNLGSLGRRLSELRPDLTLVLPDLTGHGGSPALPPEPGLDDLAEDVLELARRLGARALVGHSLGGRVALAVLGLETAGDLEQVALLDIGPGAAPPEALGPGSSFGDLFAAFVAAPERFANRAEAATFFGDRGLPEPLAQWLMLNLRAQGPDGALAWGVARQSLARLHEGSAALDLWARLEAGARRGVSLLCLRGGASPFVSAADQRALEGVGVTVATLEGAGHFVHVDALEEVAARLARWLSR